MKNNASIFSIEAFFNRLFPKRKKIYIAGKVTGEDFEVCFQKFLRAENRIRLNEPNAIILNPMRFVKKDSDWESAMRLCLRKLSKCDALYALEDWHESKGARLEVDIFYKMGLQLYNMNFLKLETNV